MSKEPSSPQPANPNFKVFQSTNLERGYYSPEARVLEIVFVTGQSYIYTSVPESVWYGLRDSVSPGSYFSSKIRSNPDYPSRKKEEMK